MIRLHKSYMDVKKSTAFLHREAKRNSEGAIAPLAPIILRLCVSYYNDKKKNQDSVKFVKYHNLIILISRLKNENKKAKLVLFIIIIFF